MLAVQAWVGVGSADETPAQAGVAHVVEHMLFKGSCELRRRRADARDRGRRRRHQRVDRRSTTPSITRCSARDHVDGAIDAIGDALTAPRVDPEELARERQVILEEIRQGSDDPARTSRRACSRRRSPRIRIGGR